MSAAAQLESGKLELISFEIAGAEFCVDIRTVKEIRGWTPATPIPQAPSYVRGVINLRGAVVPVIDLRDRLGLGSAEPTQRHVVIIVQHDRQQAGLLVDGVQETMEVDPDLLQPPPLQAGEGSHRFVDAMLPLEGRMLSRLVVPSLLAAKADGAVAGVG